MRKFRIEIKGSRIIELDDSLSEDDIEYELEEAAARLTEDLEPRWYETQTKEDKP